MVVRRGPPLLAKGANFNLSVALFFSQSSNRKKKKTGIQTQGSILKDFLQENVSLFLTLSLSETWHGFDLVRPNSLGRFHAIPVWEGRRPSRRIIRGLAFPEPASAEEMKADQEKTSGQLLPQCEERFKEPL